MAAIVSSGKSVLVVGTFLSVTRGTRSVCEDLAAQLAQSGWRVLTTSEKAKRFPRLVDMVGTTWRKRHEYQVAQVDVYSGPAFVWAEAVCFVLRLSGKPYVLTLHGGDLPAFARRWPRRVQRLLSSSAAVTAPSRYLLDQMKQYREDLQLHPNPLDLRNYGFKLRRQAKPRLVWLRAFHNIYNPMLATRVLALLESEFPDIRLTMIGPDKEDGSLSETRSLAGELGVAQRMSLIGSVPKSAIPDSLNQGDIFLNTTGVDNTPISVLEAMACGLCIVSTNVGGVPHLLKHEHTALLVPPGDQKAMAAAVRRILTEPGLAERLSGNARREAEQFDWSLILPRWQQLLMSATDGQKIEMEARPYKRA